VRFAALLSVVALAGLTLAALPVGPTETAVADSPSCLEGYADFPNLKGAPRYGTDTEVGVYIDGTLSTGSGASEMEGKFVIGGDAVFDSGAYFNVGVVGAGSQVTPAAMTDMLITGGDVVVGAPANFVEVGNLIGGNIVAGGTVTGGGPSPTAFVNTNGGSITENAAAPLAAYSTIPTYYQALSSDYDALTDTGIVTNDAGNVYFDGNGTDTRQVFTVAGSVLGAIGATKSMVFTNIPTDAVVIINVTGASAVVSANSFSFSTTSTAGATVNPTAPEPDRVFSQFTQSLLWNFPSATSVTLGDQDQLLGSILVPTAASSLQLFTSTNGRIYVNGSLTLGGGTQAGLEIHNYPFREACTVTPTTGSISVNKVLSDPDSVVDPDRLFTGTISCTVGTPTPSTWSIEAGQTATFSGIPSGSECTIAEDALTVAPSSTDSSYVWQPSTFLTPNVITVAAGSTSTVQVLNQVRRALGDLELVKVLDDPFNVVSLSRIYTGTFECEHLGATIESGTWSTTAGAPAISLATDLPAGTVCSVSEDALTEPPLAGFPQYIWRSPVITPASVTIADGVTSRVTVTNIVYDPIAELASTGTDAALPLWIGGGAMLAGLAIVLVGYRRRRSA
jgi:choice-of-anchor A domain-containing protein/LPXTG-motif cell wall-anchored protein